MKNQLLAGVAGLAMLSLTPAAHAFVDWVANPGTGTVGPSGSNSVLSWDGGGSDNGLFGSPILYTDTFLFVANQNFTAESTGVSNVTVSDTLRVHVHATSPNGFSEVVFSSAGDYTLVGDQSTVNITGQMTINNLSAPGSFNDSFHSSSDHHGAFPRTGPAGDLEQDTWSGYSIITFASPLTDIELIFSNNLIAVTGGEDHAVIATLPNTQGSFSLQLVPTPGTALMGLVGLGVLTRRRR